MEATFFVQKMSRNWKTSLNIEQNSNLRSILFMALRLAVASSSDCPPDKKVTPGIAHGTVLRNAVTVAKPISSAVALFSHDCP